MIVIKYWGGILARASGLFRMCEEAGIEWQHVTAREMMGAALLGASNTTNLAPPIVEDGNDVIVSQAVPCHQYLGEKLGFDQNIPVPQIALQYMEDLSDLHNELMSHDAKGKESNNVDALQEYITGDRYKQHLGAINRSIQGPFYFGETPTYVDFAVCSYLDMSEGKWLGPLEEKSVDTIQAYAPKLRSVATAIRGLKSAEAKLSKLALVPPSFVLTPERVATWK